MGKHRKTGGERGKLEKHGKTKRIKEKQKKHRKTGGERGKIRKTLKNKENQGKP